MTGVLLFSGRWRMSGNEKIIWLYKHNLINPYHLDVVFGAAQSQVCDPRISKRAFSKLVHLQWNMGASRFRTLFISSTNHDSRVPELSSSTKFNYSPWKLSMINNWRIQFHHLRLTLEYALQWKLHSFYVRCRFDMMLLNRPSFQTEHLNRHVYVINYTNSMNLHLTVMDWFYVASLRAISIMTDTRYPMYNISERCHAACPEEQVMMQLRRRNYSYLRTRAIFQRVPKEQWCMRKR